MSNGSMSAPGTNYLYKSIIYGCLGIFAHIFAHNVIKPAKRLLLRRPLLGEPALVLVQHLRRRAFCNRSALQRITQLSGQ